MQVKAVRKPGGLDKVRTTRVDAGLIAEALRIGRYDETRLATDEVASLRSLSRYLQSLRGMVAELKTQCVCLMDAHFPEYAGGVLGHVRGRQPRGAVKSRCPSSWRAGAPTRSPATSPRRSRRGGKSAGYAAKTSRRGQVVDRRELGQEARLVPNQVPDKGRRVRRLRVREGRGEVRALLDEVEPLVLTIPGASYVAGAQIVSEIGDVSRFRSAPAPVSYAGLNSSVSQSGKFDSGGGPITKHGSPYLRRALWLAANRARQYDPGLRAFYDKKRAEGKPHRVAVTAVARRLCHIVFAVMRNQVPYDPERE